MVTFLVNQFDYALLLVQEYPDANVFDAFSAVNESIFNGIIPDNYEETEALATVDILRRGEVDVTTVSLTGRERVMGKHSVPVVADALFEDAKDGPFDMLVVPGGTIAYTEHEGLLELVRRYDVVATEPAALPAFASPA